MEQTWYNNDSLCWFGQQFSSPQPEWIFSFGTNIIWSITPFPFVLTLAKDDQLDKLVYDVGNGTITVQKLSTVLDVHMQLQPNATPGQHTWDVYDSIIMSRGDFSKVDTGSFITYTSITVPSSTITLYKTVDGSLDLAHSLDLSLVGHGWQEYETELDADL